MKQTTLPHPSSMSQPLLQIKPTTSPRVLDAQEPNIIPITGYRRAMVKSMTAAAAVPHFHFCDEVLMDKLVALRMELKAIAPADVGLTVLPFTIKALSLALHEHPQINAQLSPQLDALHCFPYALWSLPLVSLVCVSLQTLLV